MVDAASWTVPPLLVAKGQGLDDPGEVPKSFATKGVGWSGREDQEEDNEAQS